MAAYLSERLTDPLARFDARVAEVMQGYAADHPLVADAMRVVSTATKPFVWWLVLTPLAVWLYRAGRQRQALFVAVTAIGSGLVSLSVKALVDRQRPEFAEPLFSASGASFPSGHTQAAVVGTGILLLVFAVRWWAVVAAVALVVVVALSRLFLGVHFVTDVLAGALIGLTWLAVMTFAFRDARQPAGRSSARGAARET